MNISSAVAGLGLSDCVIFHRKQFRSTELSLCDFMPSLTCDFAHNAEQRGVYVHTATASGSGGGGVGNACEETFC